MIRTRASLSHPIVFVMDFDNDGVEVPDYNPGSVTSANASCVSVGAISDTDGEVEVSLADPRDDVSVESYIHVFEGVINTPAQRIAIVTSENEVLAQAAVTSKRTAVAVFVDDKLLPSNILIRILPEVRGTPRAA